MATAPFGVVLEAALKENIQGGTFTLQSGHVVNPRFFCCISGTTVDVDKDPVAMAIVSATTICTGVAITVDYSHSWSPSSTINSWSVAWGDGQVSAGAWPGAGSVAHPLGGYVLPGTYTITLTVTDLLGATGLDTVQVTVLDCTIWPGMMMYAGCGASGVWYTNTGGLSWADAGGESLGQPLVYDVKPNWFTIGLEETELWAATDEGLFTGTGVGANVTWKKIKLPQPPGFPGVVLQVAAVCPSKYDPLEVYVIAYDATHSWLYRTVDAGETWTSIQIEGCDSSIGTTYRESIIYGSLSSVNTGHFAKSVGFMYAVDGAENSFRIGRRNDGNNTWAAIGGMGIRFLRCLANGDGTSYYLWACGSQAALAKGITLQGYDGIGWTSFDGNKVMKASVRVFGSPGYVYTADWGETGIIDPGIRVFTGAGVLHANYDTPGGMIDQPRDMYVYNNELFVAMDMSGLDYIYRHLGAGVWDQETQLDVEPTSEFVEGPDGLFFTNNLRYMWLRNDATGVWEQDRFSVPASEDIYTAWRYGDIIYVGTDRGKIYKRDSTYGYSLVGSVSCDETYNIDSPIYGIYYHDSAWLASVHYDTFGADSPDIYRIPGPLGGLVPHPDGRTHIIDMSPDGMFIYLVLINADNEPVVFRASYDLSEYARIYEPTGGTWGGVVCDYFYINRVWVFGDLTALIKIRVSDDWGDTWTTADEGAWGAAELVRPLLPSIYDPSDVCAILNNALQAWHSGDDGETWVNMGATTFAAHCGARDWIDDTFLLIGRQVAGAAHLQWSEYLGVNWYERSTGITAASPITAIAIVG